MTTRNPRKSMVIFDLAERMTSSVPCKHSMLP